MDANPNSGSDGKRGDFRQIGAAATVGLWLSGTVSR